MKRIIAALIIGASLFCWSSFSQAGTPYNCSAHLYNRNGAYAVCTSGGGYYRGWVLCSTGQHIYGPWRIANGWTHSDAWCSPASVVSYGVGR